MVERGRFFLGGAFFAGLKLSTGLCTAMLLTLCHVSLTFVCERLDKRMRVVYLVTCWRERPTNHQTKEAAHG